MRLRRIRPSSTPISASRTKEHCVIGLGQFLEVLIGGLMSGVLYSLVALGFVLIFKASGVFNFAQGAMVLLAGLALVRSLDFLVAKGFPIWAAIIIGIGFAAVIMAMTAWLVERFVIGPLVNQDGLTLFMSTIGVTFILEGAAQMFFGSDAYPLRLFPTDNWFLFENLFPGGILVNQLDVWGGFIAGILVGGLVCCRSRCAGCSDRVGHQAGRTVLHHLSRAEGPAGSDHWGLYLRSRSHRRRAHCGRGREDRRGVPGAAYGGRYRILVRLCAGLGGAARAAAGSVRRADHRTYLR